MTDPDPRPDPETFARFSRAADRAERASEQMAARVFRASAEQGHAHAQLNLGLMYRHGAGVPKDDAEAQRELAHAYYHGEGVRKNQNRAWDWYALSAKTDHRAAALFRACLQQSQ